MNQTEYYQLSQWDPEDRIQRTDFNTDNAKLEEALADHAAALAGCGNCEIYTTSYVGNGAYGSGSKNTLTFPRMPILVCVFSNGTFGFFTEKSATVGTSSGVSAVSYSWNGLTLSWHGSNANWQLNFGGSHYGVVALLAADA